jgi:hypothetical protein
MPKPVGTRFTVAERTFKYDKKLREATNGEVWLFEPKTDYDCSESNFRQHVKSFAERHNYDYGFNVRKGDRGVVGVEVAFVPKGEQLPEGLDSDGDTQRSEAPEPDHDEHRAAA